MTSKYQTSANFWSVLGEDAFTKSRGVTSSESPDASRTKFTFDNDNWISGSLKVYTTGTQVTSSAFTTDLDDGIVTFTSAPTAGTVLTADYDFTGVKDSAIQTLLLNADDELDNSTGRNFGLKTTSEFLDADPDQKVFFVNEVPIISLTNISTNIAESIQDAPSWEARTEGIGSDFLKNTGSGMIEFIDNFPLAGRDRVQVTYVSGYTIDNVPALVKELHALLAQRSLVQSTVFASIIRGRDNFSPADTSQINKRIERLIQLLRYNKYERI